MENSVTWGEVKDRHIVGSSLLGQVFIRLNREDKVSGIYLMFDDIEKFVPKNEKEETVEGAKELTHQLIINKIESKLLLLLYKSHR